MAKDLNAKLIPLKSEITGREPTAEQCDVGEIAINLTDRKIFSKRSDGTVVVLAGGSKIQDAEDFEPNIGLPRFYSFNYAGSQKNPAAGEWTNKIYSGYSGPTFSFTDLNGDAVPLPGNGENPPFWFSTDDGATWTRGDNGTRDWHADGGGMRYICIPAALIPFNDSYTLRMSFDDPLLADALPLYEGDLIQWDNTAQAFMPVQATDLGLLLEDLDNVSDTAPKVGQGLEWNGTEWVPTRYASIEQITRPVPAYRWTLAPGANPGPGEYRVAADGIELSKIDADGTNLEHWFRYYPDASGPYWWSPDDNAWTESTYNLKQDSGEHLKLFTTAAKPNNPAELYVALGEPGTTEQLDLIQGDLIQWDGSAWVPINPADLIVDITDFSIGDLKDVDTSSSPPVNGQVLTWDATAGAWKPAEASQGVNYLKDLLDVSVGSVTDGQLLGWSFADSAWVPVDPPASGIGEAPDLELDGELETGDVLVFDGDVKKWKTKQEADLAIDLSRYAVGDLSDVDTTTVPPALGEALVWNGTEWIPGVVEGGGGDSGGGWMGNRSDDEMTTKELADQENDGSIVFLEMGQSGTFVSVTTSAAAWVRLYTNANDRDIDASRIFEDDPQPGSGVLLELLTTDPGQTIKITPGSVYFNNDPLPASRIYANVANRSGATQAVTVTITCISQTFFDVISGGTFGSGR